MQSPQFSEILSINETIDSFFDFRSFDCELEATEEVLPTRDVGSLEAFTLRAVVAVANDGEYA